MKHSRCLGLIALMCCVFAAAPVLAQSQADGQPGGQSNRQDSGQNSSQNSDEASGQARTQNGGAATQQQGATSGGQSKAQSKGNGASSGRSKDQGGAGDAGQGNAQADSQSSGQGDIAAGQETFYTCRGCHGIPEYSNAYPTFHVPKLGGQHAAYIVSALKEYRKDKRKHSTMHAQASSLSDQDMQNIAAYLSQRKAQ